MEELGDQSKTFALKGQPGLTPTDAEISVYFSISLPHGPIFTGAGFAGPSEAARTQFTCSAPPWPLVSPPVPPRIQQILPGVPATHQLFLRLFLPLGKSPASLSQTQIPLIPLGGIQMTSQHLGCPDPLCLPLRSHRETSLASHT